MLLILYVMYLCGFLLIIVRSKTGKILSKCCQNFGKIMNCDECMSKLSNFAKLLL
jgi:hypothetical protein